MNAMNCRECPLQLPPQQLESALNKYASLRGSLAAYARQPSIRTSLPRYSSLGLVHHSFCDILLVMIVEGVSSQHSDFIGVRIKTWIRIWTRMRLWDSEITKIIFLNNLVVSTWIFSEQTIKFNETYCQICIMKSSYGGYIHGANWCRDFVTAITRDFEHCRREWGDRFDDTKRTNDCKIRTLKDLAAFKKKKTFLLPPSQIHL